MNFFIVETSVLMFCLDVLPGSDPAGLPSLYREVVKTS
jgi:hypothetical protein